jgi:hypothetical protein
MGYIQMRLGKGEFKIYPNGQSLGATIPMQEIPPFSQIKGIIPVGRTHMGWVSSNTITSQSKPLRKLNSAQSTVIRISFPSNNNVWFSQHFLLSERNNTTVIGEWLSQEKNFWEQVVVNRGDPASAVVVESVDIFEAPRCWLVSIVALRTELSVWSGADAEARVKYL